MAPFDSRTCNSPAAWNCFIFIITMRTFCIDEEAEHLKFVQLLEGKLAVESCP